MTDEKNDKISDYTYNEDLGRCYKLHKTALNWTEAALVCDIEQSYLAIANSESEAEMLVLMSKGIVGADGVASTSCDSVALGFSNKNNREWKTVLGNDLLIFYVLKKKKTQTILCYYV